MMLLASAPPTSFRLRVAYDYDNWSHLIHMGGRVYDPALGRFLSPDPNIPAPGNTQAFNRYAYVYNNPLRYTDPSGFMPTQRSRHGSVWNPPPPTSGMAGYAVGGFHHEWDSNWLGHVPFQTQYERGHVRELSENRLRHMTAAQRSDYAYYSALSHLYSALSDAPPGAQAQILSELVAAGRGDVASAVGRSLAAAATPDLATYAGIGLEYVAQGLGYLWNAPNTVVGLVFGAVGYVAGLIIGTDPHISFGNNAIQFWNNPLMTVGQGFTAGNAISYQVGVTTSTMNAYSDPTVNVSQHEGAHTWQSMVLGPFMLPVWLINGGPDPSVNQFERAAQDYGRGGNRWCP